MHSERIIKISNFRHCKAWSGLGECAKNSKYMKVKCAKSCQTCYEPPVQDKHKYCKRWAEMGECDKNK